MTLIYLYITVLYLYVTVLYLYVTILYLYVTVLYLYVTVLDLYVTVLYNVEHCVVRRIHHVQRFREEAAERSEENSRL